jgi:hypothetical protein
MSETAASTSTTSARLRALLARVRVTDPHDGNVSLTSLVLAGAGAGVAAAPSWYSLGAFAIAASLFAHKKHLALKRGDAATARVLEEAVAKATKALAEAEAVKSRLTAVENRTTPQALGAAFSGRVR